jgi:hypothetical protein
MNKVRSVGVLFIVAIVALVVTAGTASAVTVQPAGTGTTDSSSNFTLTYDGSLVITCGSSVATGTTASPAGASHTKTVTSSVCSSNIMMMSVSSTSCTITETWSATGGGSGTAIVASATTCSYTVGNGFCTISIAPQTSSSKPGSALTASSTTMQVTANFNGTRTGSAICGAASGAAVISAGYGVSPANLTITNP